MIMHGYRETRRQRYWGHEFDLWGLRDVIGRVTVGSTYAEYPTLNQIRTGSDAWLLIYPLNMPTLDAARRTWRADTVSKTKALLS